MPRTYRILFLPYDCNGALEINNDNDEAFFSLLVWIIPRHANLITRNACLGGVKGKVGCPYNVVCGGESVWCTRTAAQGVRAVIVPAGDWCSISKTNVLLAEVGVGGLDEGGELAHLVEAIVSVADPVDVGIPELVVVGGVGGRALLELGDVNGVFNVQLIGKVLVVDHLELGKLALGAGAIAYELVEEGVSLVVVEEHVGTLIGELGVVGLDVLADADVGGASIGIVPLCHATHCANVTIVLEPGGAGDGVGSGGRVKDGRVGISSAISGITSRHIQAFTRTFAEIVDAKAPLAKVATVVAADAGADGHAGVLAVVGDLDASVLTGDSGLIERGDPVSPRDGADGSDRDGGNESLPREQLHGWSYCNELNLLDMGWDDGPRIACRKVIPVQGFECVESSGCLQSCFGGDARTRLGGEYWDFQIAAHRQTPREEFIWRRCEVLDDVSVRRDC